MYKYQDIRVVHLEISSRCNAACPDCPRNLRGVDIEHLNHYEVKDLGLNEIKQLFPKKFIQQLKILLINGNHGDFITCRDGLDIVKYFVECNPDISIEISTNASGQPKIWSELGRIPNVHVLFRIDGLRDTHHLYRQYTDFDLILANAQEFIATGGWAEWHMIKFDFNQHQIEQAQTLSKELGFKFFNLVDHGRDNMVVFNRQGQYSHTIGNPVHEQQDYQSLLDVRTQSIDHKKFYASCKSRKINCRVKKLREIYVQSNGEVYPCCWTGRAPKTNGIASGNDQIASLAKNNNALEVGLERAVEWFNDLERAWSIEKVADGQPWICNNVCGS